MLYILLFLFTDPDTTEIYTLSLHDALPIYRHPLSCRGGPGPRQAGARAGVRVGAGVGAGGTGGGAPAPTDRKSTRLNSSHANISYAVFCLKKKMREPAVR